MNESSSRGPARPNKPLRVDVHAHYYPGEYLDMLKRFGSDTTEE